MITLELWRCASCPRILGEKVRLGDGSHVRAICWGCGTVNILGEVGSDHVKFGIAEESPTLTDAAPTPKRPKLKASISSDG